MSQIYIFNFFPGSVHSGRILKMLSLFASRQKHTYLPNNQVWLNKLYFQISNSNEKKCLTIDTRDVNDLGPGKFRTSAENNLEQIVILTETIEMPGLNLMLLNVLVQISLFSLFLIQILTKILAIKI